MVFGSGSLSERSRAWDVSCRARNRTVFGRATMDGGGCDPRQGRHLGLVSGRIVEVFDPFADQGVDDLPLLGGQSVPKTIRRTSRMGIIRICFMTVKGLESGFRPKDCCFLPFQTSVVHIRQEECGCGQVGRRGERLFRNGVWVQLFDPETELRGYGAGCRKQK